VRCIKGCGRPASATPWLCGQCLRILAIPLVRFELERSNRWPPADPDMALKSYLNKVQKKSRQAAKRRPRES